MSDNQQSNPEPIRWPVEFTSDKLFKNLERERMVTDLATLRRKLDGLQKEVRTVMSIKSDETAMPGCECQRCRIIRALDGAAGMEGK